jgi:hypothetical protein
MVMAEGAATTAAYSRSMPVAQTHAYNVRPLYSSTRGTMLQVPDTMDVDNELQYRAASTGCMYQLAQCFLLLLLLFAAGAGHC